MKKKMFPAWTDVKDNAAREKISVLQPTKHGMDWTQADCEINYILYNEKLAIVVYLLLLRVPAVIKSKCLQKPYENPCVHVHNTLILCRYALTKEYQDVLEQTKAATCDTNSACIFYFMGLFLFQIGSAVSASRRSKHKLKCTNVLPYNICVMLRH